jgi:hypothetical protein
VIVKLRVAVHDRESRLATHNLRRADRAELAAIALGREEVGFVGFGELALDGGRNAPTEPAVAVATVNDDVKPALERERQKIPGQRVHAQS